MTTETKSVKAITGASMPISSARGSSPGLSATTERTPQYASSRPSTPPASASSRLSVSSWRTSRSRLAPSAVRTAISFERAAARASNRLATLAQAMSSTNPTAPSSTSSAGRTSPTARWASGVVTRLQSDA